MKNVIAVAAALAATVPLAAAMPAAVSPGEPHRASLVEVRCPTFSWGLVPGAERYVVAVVALDDAGEAADEGTVLEKTLPGSVGSWTPSLGSCLERGRRYAWVVSAYIQPDGEEAAETSSSEPRFFAVATGGPGWSSPGVHREPEGGQGPRVSPIGASGSAGANDWTGDEEAGAIARPPGSRAALLGAVPVALRAESESDTTQPGVGVAGIADSPGGAGVLAANRSPGGADLVLDGSAASLPDTALTESGIVAGGPSFELTNAAGDLALSLNGTAVTTAATDQDTLAGLSCAAADEVAKWDGSQWLCLREESAFAAIAPDTGSQPLADVPGDVLSITGAGNILVHGPGGDALQVSVVQGSGSGLDADTLDGVEASGFSGAGHGHFGEEWVGSFSPVPGLKVTSSPAGNPAILGEVTALGSGLGVSGVEGMSYGQFSSGVRGTSAGSNGFGVQGFGHTGVQGDGKTGVEGRTTSEVGVPVGVRGVAFGPSGTGVGVVGITYSSQGLGGSFRNAGGAAIEGVALRAEGSSNTAPDIVLGGGGGPNEDDGVLATDPAEASSDMFLVSNDAVIIQLEADGSAGDEDADLEVRRNGGVVIFRVDDTAGVTIADGLIVNEDSTINGNLTVNGVFNNPSDRARKENVAPADVLGVLEGVAALPIRHWNFIDDPDHTPHLGPMAQEFHAAFGLGADERYIASVDADGVALAAIQGLYRLVADQQVELNRLQGELARLRGVLEAGAQGAAPLSPWR